MFLRRKVHCLLLIFAFLQLNSVVESGTATTDSGTQATETGTQATETGTQSTESGTQSTESGTQSTETGTQATETGTQSTESGTQSTESGTQSTELGTQSTESGTQSTESGTQSTESGTQSTESDTQSTESGTQATESGTQSTESGTQSESGTQATESGTQATESGTQSTESGTQATETGTQSTELGTQSTESGTQSTESGTQSTESGTQSTESGTQSTESGTQSTESGTQSTQSGPQSTESGTQSTESGTQSESGTQFTESGTQSTESGTQSTESGTQSTESGTQSTESGTQATETGTQSTELGTQSTESGTQSTDSGLQATESAGTQAPQSSTQAPDIQDPVVTCPSNVPSVTASFGSNNAIVSWSSMPSATDNVDTISDNSIICRDASNNVVISGGTYGVGTTTVTCTVSDSSSNEGSCQFTISITACGLTPSSCVNGGTFESTFCECACPQMYSGSTCEVGNPCDSNPGVVCSDASTGRYCQRSLEPPYYTCQCQHYDSYFMVSNSCLRRPSVRLTFRVFTKTFTDAYRDQATAAFKVCVELLIRLVSIHLRNNPSTSNVVSVHVLTLEPGSIIPTFAVEFPEGVVPPAASVRNAILSAPTLTDGPDTIVVDPNSVTVQDATSECEPNYCSNQGVCVRSGYFPDFTYTCSCPTSFTGDRCETVIPSEVMTTTAPPLDGLSTLAIILIIAGSILLLLVIVAVCFCFLFLQPRQHTYSSYLPVYRRKPVGTLVPVEYDEYNAYLTPALNKDDIRMESLRRDLRHSPYSKQRLASQQDFIRPYVVSGLEGPYSDSPSYEGSSAGRVVYNPAVSHYY